MLFRSSELLNAAVGWATGKSKALKNEIEDLRCEISTHEETIERLQDKIQTIQNDHSRELMQLEAKHRSELNRKETEHVQETTRDRKSTRLNSSHPTTSRMPSSA